MHALRASESGFAVPTVLLAIVAAFALGSVAVVGAVTTQRGTVRDQNSKEALAAAESGVNEALMHYNRIVTNASQPCVVGTTAGLAPIALTGGWCAPVTRSVAGMAGAQFTYWVRPTTGEIQIVSQGQVGGVSRKVEVVARSSSGLEPFNGSAGVIGLDYIHMNSNGRVTGDVGTNGNITMNSNAEIHCDYSHIGPGRQVITNSNAIFDCPTPEQGTISLPPVNQGDVRTNNSNGRFFAQDTYSGGTPNWNASRRELILNSNTTLTLGGTNYSFCSIILNSNSAIYIRAGSTVRLYFDSPESCGYGSNSTQLTLNSNSRISTTGGTPSHVALLFVGSDTRTTNAILNSNTQANESCEQDYVIYAPRTNITFNSNSFFCGAIAGKSIMLNSNADIRQSNLASEFELPNTVAHHFAPEEFVDCGSSETNPPDAGC